MVAALATAFALAVPAGAARQIGEGELPEAAPASSAVTAPSALPTSEGHNVDDIPSPMAQVQRAQRQQAAEAVVNGKASANSNGVVKLAPGQYVELEREDTDLIWTVLGEFGDLESPFGILQGGMVGPQRNQIPEPDRSVDNTTIWVEDFDVDYFEGVMFENDVSVRALYEEMSSNRYSVDGGIEDWVQVPFRAAHYGRDWCGSIVCSTTWWFVDDTLNVWYQEQLDAGMSATEIDDYLSQYDTWDRYDHDGDGNFDEPDGYIDHFQIVHAGEGQEAGGGAYGSDAIWSHRWYVQLVGIGTGGPTLDDGTTVPFGGTPIGGSKYWIGDYTIEPENGGVGVFAHEYAHDLGLPDLYDTSGNTCGSTCENSTGFWTLMSSGSWMNDGGNDIGSRPNHMGAWEKFQLGWLDYEVAFADTKSTHKLGPSTTTTKQAQALIVVLPDKQVTTEIATPPQGEKFFYSGQGNNLDNTMTRSITPGTTLTALVNYDIEVDWDYAYLIGSTDGTTWNEIDTNVSTTTDPNGQNFGFGITGNSGGWVALTADVSGYSHIGFRYWTDVAVVNPGFMVDDIQIDGVSIGDAEDDGADWAFTGFKVTTGTEESSHFNAYIAEFRQYRGEDAGLASGPYNFGFLDNPTLGNWVERFPYQDGLLISYWDTSQSDNSTSAHPGEGLILPIDAHPATMYRGDGGIWRSRVQTYDSTFSLEPTDAIELHWLSQSSYHPSQPAVSVFDDNNQYYNPETPTAGVINPHTDTQIIIRSVSQRGNFMQVEVR